MPPTLPPDPIPLVVDLDGTVIYTDLMWEHLARLLRRNPFSIFQILFWWTYGRAYLKKKLVEQVKVDPSTLPYNQKFIAWVRQQKIDGRKVVLATASDLRMAQPVADHLGIFDEVLASDGKTNLRSENKLKALTQRFGERGFDYAGNSSADFAVWRGARAAIIVNASLSVTEQASRSAKIAEIFPDGYSPFTQPIRVLNELFIRSGYLLAIAAGILLAMAFPNFGIMGFAWIAPGLMVFAARNKSKGDSFRIGYIGGLVFWLMTLSWLLLIPAFGYPILGWLALSAFMALFTAIWLWLVNWNANSWSLRVVWALSGAAVWVGMEILRAHVLGGFPWNFIGVSQFHMTPLLQIASVTGVYGVSFLVVWGSLCLYSAGRMVFEKSRSRFAWQPEIFLPLFVVAGLFAWGEFKMLSTTMRPTGLQQYRPEIRITLVQPSIPQSMIWDQTVNSNRFRQFLAQSGNALTNHTDLMLWPESAVPDLDDATFVAITNFIGAHHIWLIFNADDVESKANSTKGDPYDVYNAAFLFDPNGAYVNLYRKQKLVIFGEYIPLVKWLPFVKWFTPITDGYEAGNAPAQFGLLDPPAQTSPLICFEDMFPQLARRTTQSDTDFLVNLTNDGWFGNGAEQWQHMAGALFRAVENGVPLVRCCNNGVTCWIDGNGRIHDILHDRNGTVYGQGATTIQLPLQAHAQTYYNRHGDWFGWDCVGVTVLIFARRIYEMRAKQS